MQEQSSPPGRPPIRGASAGVDHTSIKREGVQPVDQALLGGVPHRVGQFEYRYDSDTWTWSDAVAMMHGHEPGQVVPDTALILSHEHPACGAARTPGIASLATCLASAGSPAG